MIQPDDMAGKVSVAIARYKQGRCPGCGKSQGEPRGLEYRVRSRDLYCHSCRRSWPIEIDPTAFGEEPRSLEPRSLEPRSVETARADAGALPVYGPSVQQRDPGQRQKGLTRLVRLFQRIVPG
ncbi:MAG TPA: hypothetical protein VFR55_01555 [Dehalococcoidia bacterium]|nr:hypothetical protein [Dehalococcoidia bacterium]